MSLAVCICTYRRPAGLARLLRALATLRAPRPFAVYVVDNHGDGEGLAALAELQRAGLPYAVQGAASTGAGISHARNQVLQLALDGGAELLALIDDDEWPDPRWLAELLRVQAIDDADAVGGPTRPVFEHEPDPVLRGSVYYGADLALDDNAPCTLEACGNALLKAELLRRLQRPWFDPDLGHSGGEDQAFFMRLQQAGARMRWAPQAHVFESVPPARSNRAWLARRVALIANARLRNLQKHQPGAAARALRLAKTAVLALQALAYTAVTPLGARWRYRALVHRAKLLGKLQAHSGQQLIRGDEH